LAGKLPRPVLVCLLEDRLAQFHTFSANIHSPGAVLSWPFNNKVTFPPKLPAKGAIRTVMACLLAHGFAYFSHPFITLF
jgi:hypothetical protein